MKTSHFSRMGIVCMALVVLTYFQSSGLLRAQDVGFEATKAAAEKGDPEAEYDLARCYERGTGVEKDYAKAADYLTKAAEQGNALAQYAMGGFYLSGRGVAKDVNKVIKWWRKAAEQNHAEAEAALGQLYFTPFDGRTNHINFQEATKWLREAAEQGQVVA